MISSITEIKIGIGYFKKDGERIEHFPANMDELADIKVQYL